METRTPSCAVNKPHIFLSGIIVKDDFEGEFCILLRRVSCAIHILSSHHLDFGVGSDNGELFVDEGGGRGAMSNVCLSVDVMRGRSSR